MSEYDESEGWSDDLERLAASVRPTPEALPLVRDGIRRRQRRRSALVVAASVAMIAGISATALGLERASRVLPSSPAMTTADAGTFSCPDRWQPPGEPPEIADRAEQEQVIASVEARQWTGFTVRYATVTPLGVAALVEGDFERAQSELTAAGVDFVSIWDPSDPEAIVGMATQVDIKSILREVVRVRFDVDGYAGTAIWHDAGAAVLMWRAPVPPEVEALAGLRPNGVMVVIQPTDYSSRDLSHARHPLMDAIRAGRFPVMVTMSGSCPDQSGLKIGVRPPLSDQRRAEMQRQMSDIAGVPVMVVPAMVVDAW